MDLKLFKVSIFLLNFCFLYVNAKVAKVGDLAEMDPLKTERGADDEEGVFLKSDEAKSFLHRRGLFNWQEEIDEAQEDFREDQKDFEEERERKYHRGRN